MKNIVLSTLVLATVGLVGIGCSPKRSGGVELNARSSLMAAPKEGTSPIRAQLTRYRGQTEFLTFQGNPRPTPVMAAAAPEARSAGGGAPRAEQESDVFKVGKPGTKLLYLLNNYRGLQVVSYKDGADAPQLLGRAEPSGNYPSDMYLDPKHDRLYVLERVWFNASTSTYNANQSRILVYDVSDPANPVVSETVDVKGEIADSRMVGDVLYLVTTLRPDTDSYSYRYQNVSPSQGIVTSYNLSGARVTQVQQMNLTLPAVYGNNLRVVTVPEGNSYKYYLMAALSENGWGWWDRKSMVQVVDISDDKGQISNVMTVSVKGFIRRPHQMQIKNNTLIAVSNYVIEGTQTPNQGRTRIARLAVETFKFPTAQSELLTENEAELRRLYIEKNVQLESAKGVDAEQSRQKWVNDATWGVHGRFVQTKDQLRKIMPDSVVTTGDTTGQSADLQDVRVFGNWLYAFWVPQNQVDPLDLFDISAPEKGVSHIQRLTFDGWISRAEPISYQGRNYIIGLGWIVPAVNNENNKRYAQVKLFEITAKGKSVKATEVSSLTLSQNNFWANFNGQDKLIEFKQTTDGKGEILFEGSRYTDRVYEDGGQLITFDLSQADNDAVFKEGSFLAGNASWIKRIFTNSEIDRINSFSDKALVTYGSSQSPTIKAANVLELARDIRSYITLGSQGVQIITEGSQYSADESAQTILRGVAKNNVDAEKPAALNEIALPGYYATHLVSADKTSVLVITTKMTTTKDKYYSYKTWYQVHQVSLAKNGKLNLISSDAWTPAEKDNSTVNIGVSRSIMPSRYSYGTPSLFNLSSGEILIATGSELKLISASDSISTKSLAINGCDLNKDVQGEIKRFNDQLYLVRTTPVDLKTEFNTYARASKNEILPLTLTNSDLSCGQAINVPGNVIAFDGHVMITSDSWVADTYSPKTETDKEEEASQIFTGQSGLTSLKVVSSDAGAHAVLVDGLNLEDGEASGYIALPKSFSSSVAVMKYAAKDYDSYQPAKFRTLTADKDAFLTQSDAIMNEAVEYGNLTQLLQDPAQPSVLYAVVKGWRQLQVVKFASATSRPDVVPVVPVDYKNQKQKPVKTVTILEGYSSYDDSIHFTADQKSIEVSSGLFGIKQFFIQQ